MRVLHVPVKVFADVKPVLEKNLSKLNDYSSVGVCATAQHLHEIENAKLFLSTNGFNVVDCAQVLGCDASNALNHASEVDCFIYIGSGRFHPLAIAFDSNKPVFIANPLSNAFDEITEAEKDSWMKRKTGRLTKSAAAETFGILVSAKTGQYNLDEALKVKNKLKGVGKTVFLFCGDLLSPANLMGFNVDCWVNTACPRIVDDEHEKTVVTVQELGEWLD